MHSDVPTQSGSTECTDIGSSAPSLSAANECVECETRQVSNESAVHALVNCRVCDNGELVFSIVSPDQRLIIECLECLTGYTEPTDLATSQVVRMEETESRFATQQEVEQAGMVDLLAL